MWIKNILDECTQQYYEEFQDRLKIFSESYYSSGKEETGELLQRASNEIKALVSYSIMLKRESEKMCTNCKYNHDFKWEEQK